VPLASMNVTSSRSSSTETLTERELEVARLVVDRHTTPEIARALFLSEKAIETHMRNIFRKLGVSSRADVAQRWNAPIPPRNLRRETRQRGGSTLGGRLSGVFRSAQPRLGSIRGPLQLPELALASHPAPVQTSLVER
jgi:DNA-binding CsgD family transcriptional regulator